MLFRHRAGRGLKLTWFIGQSELRWGLVFLLLVCSGWLHAAELVGRVVGVADGDTLTVLDASKTQHKVRLQGIDAPEKGQPFGQKSKEYLSSLVFSRVVRVEYDKLDRYGRVVGKVVLGGVDICLRQIDAGLAWHYKAYEREQSQEDRQLYSAVEEDARRQGHGLWSERQPVAPWDYRRAQRK